MSSKLRLRLSWRAFWPEKPECCSKPRDKRERSRTPHPILAKHPLKTTSHSPTPTTDSNSAEFPKSQNPHRAKRAHLPMPAQTADQQGSRPLRPPPSRPLG